MVWAWRGYERKTVECLTKERPDFSRQVLRSAWGQTESKIRFGSGPVDRNFRTVRPHFSIQFSISSPVIVRNRRIELKFGLLNLSTFCLFHTSAIIVPLFEFIFREVWGLWKMPFWGQFSRLFDLPHFGCLLWRMGLVRITSWCPNFNGSHFGLPPSEIHRMTGLPPKIVWTMTYSHRPHWLRTFPSYSHQVLYL